MIKYKPEVKNELLLQNTLTLHNEDEGATLRVAVLYDDMLKMEVYQPISQEYTDVMLLFSSEQVEQIITLWNEWKELEDGEGTLRQEGSEGQSGSGDTEG